MDTVKELILAIWYQDFETLANPKLVWLIYGTLFTIILLENGFLPAAFLPGDTLLILAGVLISKDTMNYPLTLAILTVGASLGCWLSYMQGKLLSHSKTVQQWIAHVPPHYHQRTYQLFDKHGLSALLIARFLAFVRTLLPIVAGLSGLKSKRFQFFNWISGFLWVTILTTAGYTLSKLPFFIKHEKTVVSLLTILPIFLLVIGLAGTIYVIWKHKSR